MANAIKRWRRLKEIHQRIGSQEERDICYSKILAVLVLKQMPNLIRTTNPKVDVEPINEENDESQVSQAVLAQPPLTPPSVNFSIPATQPAPPTSYHLQNPYPYNHPTNYYPYYALNHPSRAKWTATATASTSLDGAGLRLRGVNQ